MLCAWCVVCSRIDPQKTCPERAQNDQSDHKTFIRCSVMSLSPLVKTRSAGRPLGRLVGSLNYVGAESRCKKKHVFGLPISQPLSLEVLSAASGFSTRIWCRETFVGGCVGLLLASSHARAWHFSVRRHRVDFPSNRLSFLVLVWLFSCLGSFCSLAISFIPIGIFVPRS